MTLDDINNKLIEISRELGAEVKCLQSSHKGALIDTLHNARICAKAVLAGVDIRSV